MGKGFKPGRLGGEIQRILSEMLLRELKDPRLAGNLVSVSDVAVSKDSGYATIYLTCFQFNKDVTEEEKEEANKQVLEAMESAKGVIKREIGQKIKLRRIPELTFKIDRSFENGMLIEGLLSTIDDK